MGTPERPPSQHGSVLQGIGEEVPQAGGGGRPGGYGNTVPGVWLTTCQNGSVKISWLHPHRYRQQLEVGSGQPLEGQEEVGVDL